MKNLSIQVDKSRSKIDSPENIIKKDNFVSSLSNPAASYSNSLQSSPVVRSRYHSASSSVLGITALLHDETEFSSREVTTHHHPSTSPSAPPCLLKPLHSSARERLLSRNHLFNTNSRLSPPPPPPPPPPPLQSTRSLARQYTRQLSTSQLSDSNSLTSESLSLSSMQISRLQPSPPQSTITPIAPPLPAPPPQSAITPIAPPPPPPPPPPFRSDTRSSATKLPKTPLCNDPVRQVNIGQKSHCSSLSPTCHPPPPPLLGITSTPFVDQSPTPSIPHLSSLTEQTKPYRNQSSAPSSPFPVLHLSSETNGLPLQNIQSAPMPSPPLPPFPEKTECPFPRILSTFPSPPSLPSPFSGIASMPSLVSVVPAPPPAPSPGDFLTICQDSSVLPSEKITVPATPPPPLPFSGSNSVSVARCSVPPPPPPPPSSIQEKASRGSSRTVPPPPAPLVNGLIKAGGTVQLHESTNTGNIPAPPLVTKLKFQSRSNTRIQAQPRKTSLKPYHWLKLTRALQGSIWAEAQKPEEASKAPELDMPELESLFSATVPNSDHVGVNGKTNRRGSGMKSEKVQLIELRRAYNCEIMLKRVRVPLSDLMNSVLTLDDLALDSDQVDNLIKFCPTKEEIELLKNYKGDKENLGTCEQFFLELIKVPRIESKLRVFSFKIQFWTQVSDLRNSLKIVDSASEEVRRSVKLRRIMQTILSLGNALNHGTAKGSAVGFRLDSLPKLTETRSRNNKLTLMHYLCKVLAKNLPEVLDFEKDLINLENSSKIQLKYLAEEMQAINKGLEKVAQELTASENDGHASEHFCQTLKEFLGSAEAEVRSLASLYSGAGRNADALALYFGEDPTRCPFEQVVSTLLNFVRMFRLAHKENCQQLEFETKKAQREAENDKAKLNASEKELQNENARESAPKMSKLVHL